MHIALTGIANIPFPRIPVMFGSRCDRLGREYVGMEEVEDWEHTHTAGELLTDKCEWLYDGFCEKMEAAEGNGHANGKANGVANGHANGNGYANGNGKIGDSNVAQVE